MTGTIGPEADAKERIVGLTITETSGVGPVVGGPAHGHDGWTVMKSAELTAVLDGVRTENHTTVHTNPVESAAMTSTTQEGAVAAEGTETVETVATEPAPVEPVEKAAATEAAATEQTISKAAYDTLLAKATAAEAQAQRAEEQVTKMAEERNITKATERAGAWKLPGLDAAEMGKHLSALRDSAPETATYLEERLDQVTKAFGESLAFSEIGTASGDAAGSAAEQVIQKSEARLKVAGFEGDIGNAMDAVMAEDPALARAYLAERRGA